ncbi:MAG: DNA polymerase/3'-5' exonuclease PolX [Betaproteobacteria bacterium]|nr:DNA polymerase/3'-5' exonuclease PolX [Betaproteobacteria bacterium]MDH5222492.1 DNA polymerase/3'-5' exonuclease PolX [Betaproteobacteria bacterium]MDH5352114.1 DNA polymerase/3'-5' exonuclease PolX [Betaproteobacteria bacterium]
MAVHNADIAAAFEEIADLLELGDENPFRIRAYRNAARVVGGLSLDLAATLAAGKDLPKLPGIGEDLGGKIHEIAATGTCKLLEKLRGRFPAGITDLLRLPGVGPKRVRALHEAKIDSLEDLRRAARAGKLPKLPGFGEKTAQRISDAAQAQLGATRRFKLAVAAQYAGPLAKHVGGVVAGSYRRMRDTVGDIDILVASDEPEKPTERFVGYPEVRAVLAHGATRSSVRLASGIQADLRVVPKESYGAALHYFTGSKAHNIAVRKLGIARGLKINEYGVWRGAKRIAGEAEQSVYAAVGLPYIEPELRENQGELEAARAGKLPQLLTLADLRGDLHAHTKATDGHASAREMALAAKAAGLQYLAITDHSRRLAMARGLDVRRLEKQMAEIDDLNGELSGITLLKGIEVDILEDGSLDLPDSVLKKLDVVVAAVHGGFKLSRARQTARILAALENPCVHILAHPTGRLIGEREPYDVDMLAVVREAKARGVALELNAHPDRLDLNEVHCRMAKDEGVLVAIGSDAHGVDGFEVLRYGVGQARRGWLEKKDVLNTRPLAELRRWLASARR